MVSAKSLTQKHDWEYSHSSKETSAAGAREEGGGRRGFRAEARRHHTAPCRPLEAQCMCEP